MNGREAQMKTTHMKIITGRLLLTFTAACLAVPAFAQTSAREYSLEIERQPVADALIEFSRQTGLQFGYFPQNPTEKILVGPLSGRYTADAAITQLLLPSGLSFERLNERTIAVTGPASTKSQHRGLLGTERKTDHRTAHSFMRLADLRLAEEPAAEDVQQTGAAANAREAESDNNKRKRQREVLEEIIVTARKRTERLQDVPISIAVVSADEIDRRGLVGAEDYLRDIPGLNHLPSGYGESIVIRGLTTGTTQQNFWDGSTVATYFGETPTTTSAGTGAGGTIDVKLLDVERVEVLRGPQGTAFGNASMGGAVRTIPVAPKLDRFEGKVGAGYSVTSGTGGDNYTVQAVGNLPLIKDKLAIRATAYQYEESGFYRNRAGSDSAFQAAEVTPYGAEAFATDEEEVGAYYAAGGRIAALFQASDDLRFTLSYLLQKTETDSFPVANSGTYEQTLLQVAPAHVVRGQEGGIFDTDIDIANAMMEYNLGWANLLATYSYTKSGSIQSAAFGTIGLGWPESYLADSDHREHVGEIRLATQFDGAWNFLAGLYAEDLKDEYLADYIWHGDPATNFLAPGVEFMGVYPDRRNLEQKAAFGEVSWELLQGLTLTGGVRVYEYDRTFQVDAVGPPWGDDGLHIREDTTDSGENFRASLSYKLDDALLYATWAQGFRLGPLQTGVPSGVCDLDGDGIVDGTTSITVESTRIVNDDSVDSYELGGKFALLDRRLTIDAAVFRTEWSQIPVTVTGGSGGCPRGWLANVGDAQVEGVEFQANYQITEPFSVNFGGSWIDARLTKDVAALGVSKGDSLPSSPEFNANLSAQYEFGIGGYKAFVRADSIYVGSFYGNLQESPITKSDGYVKLDASARVEIGNLNVDLFVRNLTNEDAFTFREGFSWVGEFYGYRLRPRTIGFRLGYTF